jgi:hypothetical protein
MGKGEAQHFVVNVFKNTSPLKIWVKKSAGAVEIFYSWTNPEPSTGVFDGHHRGDTLRVSSRFAVFAEKQLFFSVVVTASTKLSVSVTYGVNGKNPFTKSTCPADGASTEGSEVTEKIVDEVLSPKARFER